MVCAGFAGFNWYSWFCLILRTVIINLSVALTSFRILSATMGVTPIGVINISVKRLYLIMLAVVYLLSLL